MFVYLQVEVCVRYLVLLTIYRNTRRELFVGIIRKSEVKMSVFPVFSFPLLKIIFILFV
jgi:hypothetical protein